MAVGLALKSSSIMPLLGYCKIGTLKKFDLSIIILVIKKLYVRNCTDTIDIRKILKTFELP